MIEFNAGDKWEGLEGMGEDILQELKAKGDGLMMDAALVAVSTVKQTLTGARSGRTYKVSKTGKLHVASAPGEPPAILNDALRGSVWFTDPKWEGWEIGFEFGPGLGTSIKADEDGKAIDVKTYAARLEYGGVDSRGVKIDARPYMAPSAERIEPQLEKLFEAGL